MEEKEQHDQFEAKFGAKIAKIRTLSAEKDRNKVQKEFKRAKINSNYIKHFWVNDTGKKLGQIRRDAILFGYEAMMLKEEIYFQECLLQFVKDHKSSAIRTQFENEEEMISYFKELNIYREEAYKSLDKLIRFKEGFSCKQKASTTDANG